jgi:hypothetical protein
MNEVRVRRIGFVAVLDLNGKKGQLNRLRRRAILLNWCSFISLRRKFILSSLQPCSFAAMATTGSTLCSLVFALLCLMASHCLASPASAAARAPAHNYSWRLPMPDRLQWETNGGYCGGAEDNICSDETCIGVRRTRSYASDSSCIPAVSHHPQRSP